MKPRARDLYGRVPLKSGIHPLINRAYSSELFSVVTKVAAGGSFPYPLFPAFNLDSKHDAGVRVKVSAGASVPVSLPLWT